MRACCLGSAHCEGGLWEDLLQEELRELESWCFVQLESSKEGGRC